MCTKKILVERDGCDKGSNIEIAKWHCSRTVCTKGKFLASVISTLSCSCGLMDYAKGCVSKCSKAQTIENSNIHNVEFNGVD